MYKSFTISLWCEGMFYKNVLSKSSWQEDQCLQGTTTNKCKLFKFLDRNYFDENTFSKMFYRCTNSYLQAHWAILQALVRASFDIYRNALYLRLNQVRFVREVNSQREITRKIYEQWIHWNHSLARRLVTQAKEAQRKHNSEKEMGLNARSAIHNYL